MHHGIGIRACLIGGQMEAPFTRWQLTGFMLAIAINIDNMIFGQLLVRNAGWRDQHTITITYADVTGSSLIQT